MFTVVNFDALAQASDFQIKRKQVVFFCWMQDLNQGLWNRISSRLNARWQTHWAIEDQAKTLNSTARPYNQRAFSPLDPISIWLSHLAIYVFVVVNFDALAQASDFQIERRQVVFLCWMQDSNQGLWNQISSRLNAHWQTDWAIKDQAKNLNSTARPYDQQAFSPLDKKLVKLGCPSMLRTHGRNGPKCSMLMLPDHLQKLFDYGWYWPNFGFKVAKKTD